MAINLNVAKFGEQFTAFEQFAAEQRDHEGFIARIEDKDPDEELVLEQGKPMSLCAKLWDGSGKFFRGKFSRDLNNDVRNLFKETILNVCGAKTIDELPSSIRAVMKEHDYDGKGHPLTARRITAVTNAVRLAAAKQIEAGAAVVSGSAPVVDRLRNVAMTSPGLPVDGTPAEISSAFTARVETFVAKELVTNFTYVTARNLVKTRNDGTRVEDFRSKHEQFDKDLNRQMRIHIEGVGDISRDFGEARDQLVKFITGNANDTFISVDMQIKKQVSLLMSLLNQFTSGTAYAAFTDAIARPDLIFNFVGNSASPVDMLMNFTLAKTEDGGIHIVTAQTIGISGITLTGDVPNGGFEFVDSNTSCFAFGLDITVPAGQLEHLAQPDWSTFDFANFDAVGHNEDLDAQIATIPDAFRLTPTVHATMRFQLDAQPQQV